MRLGFLFTCLLFYEIVGASTYKSYEDYKLLKVSGVNSEYLVRCLEALDQYGSVQLWTLPEVNKSMDMLVSEIMYPDLVEYLNELHLSHEVVIEDINKVLEKEKETVAPLGSSIVSWEFYYQYEDIVKYFRDERFSKAGGENSVSLEEFSIGKSVLGEDIILYKMSKRSRSGKEKPAIWIDGGMHGMEWISISTVIYIMNKLLGMNETFAPGNFSSNCELLDKFDMFFVPVVNVDGYKYTHTKDRFWVKNLSNHTSYKNCLGVNLNRNFGYELENRTIFTTARLGRDPCSDFHFGPHSFSEPETKAISQAIEERKEKIKLYLSLHSYSQQWLLPLGYDGKLTKDYEQLLNLARIGKSALEKTNGLKFSLSPTVELQSSTQWKSLDWAKETTRIKYAYNLELRDDGKFGYILPALQIRPTGEETFNGVSALARTLAEKLQFH